jgi:hypothetical protein
MPKSKRVLLSLSVAALAILLAFWLILPDGFKRFLPDSSNTNDNGASGIEREVSKTNPQSDEQIQVAIVPIDPKTQTLLERIREDTAGMTRISEGRTRFMQDILDAIRTGVLSAEALANLISSPNEPVIARILYAEALLAMLKQEIPSLDLRPMVEDLANVDAPVLSALMIDILGHSGQPWVFDAISDKATTESAENIRLAAIRASGRFDGEAPVQLLRHLLEDENWYRVRMSALYGLSAKNPDTHFDTIKETVDRERSLLDTPPPEGQSRILNAELVTYAAVKALAKSDAHETIAYRKSVMNDHTQPSYIRKAATKSLAGVSDAKEELLKALWDSNEGVRAVAAESLQGILTPEELSEALKPTIKNTEDPYVIEKLMAIFQNTDTTR